MRASYLQLLTELLKKLNFRPSRLLSYNHNWREQKCNCKWLRQASPIFGIIIASVKCVKRIILGFIEHVIQNYFSFHGSIRVLKYRQLIKEVQ